MIVAGIGCRRGGSAADIEAAVRAALDDARLSPTALSVLATIPQKRDEAGIAAAAARLGVALVVVPEEAVMAAQARAPTRSARVQAHTGFASVAEAAALAAAGPSARLIASRRVHGTATCALACAEDAS